MKQASGVYVEPHKLCKFYAFLYKFHVRFSEKMKQDFPIRLWSIPMLPHLARLHLHPTCHQSGWMLMLSQFMVKSSISLFFHRSVYFPCLLNARRTSNMKFFDGFRVFKLVKRKSNRRAGGVSFGVVNYGLNLL